MEHAINYFQAPEVRTQIPLKICFIFSTKNFNVFDTPRYSHITSRWMRRWGHVARMGDMRNSYRICQKNYKERTILKTY